MCTLFRYNTSLDVFIKTTPHNNIFTQRVQITLVRDAWFSDTLPKMISFANNDAFCHFKQKTANIIVNTTPHSPWCPPTTDPFRRLWVQLNIVPVPQTESRRLWLENMRLHCRTVPLFCDCCCFLICMPKWLKTMLTMTHWTEISRSLLIMRTNHFLIAGLRLAFLLLTLPA